MKGFKLGDRVQLHPACPEATAQQNGIVVCYHGEHDPMLPRVRWESGWATSHKAARLRPLTKREERKLPIPSRILADLQINAA